MNLKKLKQAEELFFNKYPGGFTHPDMVSIGKKHKMDKMITLTQESFSKENFKSTETIIFSNNVKKRIKAYYSGHYIIVVAMLFLTN